MRRYTVTIDDRTWTIDVHQVAVDTFQVTVGDATFEATIEEEGDLPGAAISPEIPLVAETRPAASPLPRAQPTSVAASVTRGAARSDLLVAPLPGVVLEIHVRAGARVSRGDPIVVLEAMKMRNTIRAPRDAVIAGVDVEAGQPVGQGDPLVRLGEPA